MISKTDYESVLEELRSWVSHKTLHHVYWEPGVPESEGEDTEEYEAPHIVVTPWYVVTAYAQRRESRSLVRTLVTFVPGFAVWRVSGDDEFGYAWGPEPEYWSSRLIGAVAMAIGASLEDWTSLY